MAEEVKDLWKTFEEAYNMISSHRPNFQNLEFKGKEWVRKFVALGEKPCSDGYQTHKVTPYMHVLAFHFETFIDLYGNVKQFSCQGVEKLNDVAKKAYFRNSNKWDAACDIIKLLYQAHLLRHKKRKVKNYSKQKDEWSVDGIKENRAKRRRLSHPTKSSQCTEPHQTTEDQ